MQVNWSIEDLRTSHNLNAEAELTDLLASEINAEIDAEILADLRALAVENQRIEAKKKKYRSIDEPWQDNFQ